MRLFFIGTTQQRPLKKNNFCTIFMQFSLRSPSLWELDIKFNSIMRFFAITGVYIFHFAKNMGRSMG